MLEWFFFSSRRRHTRSLRDWSSDVCSSDLSRFAVLRGSQGKSRGARLTRGAGNLGREPVTQNNAAAPPPAAHEIGRASCRERVAIPVVALSVKKKKKTML